MNRAVQKLISSLLGLSLLAGVAVAQDAVDENADKPMPSATAPELIQSVAKNARDSVVVVTVSGRDGKQEGLGTGFVVSEDGLIATNLHVIGDARPISVQFADGKKFDVTEIHATEKSMDLAIVRIKADGLKALELGDSEQLKAGQSVVAVGNPLGFRHSVVSGVISEKREVDGKPMLQIAMPIERGNSGGPVLDLEGRVQGIITLKSLVTRNLGFAVIVNALKPLLENPNPVPMSRWTTIGALRDRDWTQLFGARWRQRAGRIHVEDSGTGFGGRSLCLSTREVPELPFEVAVDVKFSPNDGAAGLVFHADGKDRHYGFYPSNGALRLTRFDGPSVHTWNVLSQLPHEAYHPGEWNTLKVRVEKDGLKCFINERLAVESTDTGLTSGAVGIAKFRNTIAEFRNFRVAKEIPSDNPPDEVTARIASVLDSLSADAVPTNDLIEKLLPEGTATTGVLRSAADALELRAQRIRELAVAVHSRRTQEEIRKVIDAKNGDVDLLRGALLLARLDNEEVDVDAYLREVDQIVDDIRTGLADDTSEVDRLDALNKHLFEQLGFHGSRTNYYSRSNSYVNEVIDDREGLPITLSVVYMELARRLDLKVVGVGLPGHFVVRFEPKEGPGRLLDVFDKAREMSAKEARALVAARLRDSSEEEVDKLTDQFLQATDSKSILIRMLANLRGVAGNDRDTDSVARYLDTVLVIDPDDLESRARRIDVRIRTGRLRPAIVDIDWMLDKKPEGMDLNRVLQLRADLESRLQAM